MAVLCSRWSLSFGRLRPGSTTPVATVKNSPRDQLLELVHVLPRPGHVGTYENVESVVMDLYSTMQPMNWGLEVNVPVLELPLRVPEQPYRMPRIRRRQRQDMVVRRWPLSELLRI